MLKFIVNKIIGTQNQRTLKRLSPLVDKINALEPAMKALSDEQLRAKTEEFRKQVSEFPLEAGERVSGLAGERVSGLNEILP